MSHSIQTVIFDLGNVLVRVDDRRALQTLSALTGLDADALTARLRAHGQHMVAYELGRLNALEYYHRMLEALALEPRRHSYREFCGTWCSVVVRCPEMERLFAACARVTTTCVLSNTNDLHWNYCARELDILQRAHHTLTSFQCGLYKPQLEIYQLALERFGVSDPAAAVFIDDRPENVEGARQAGMRASFRHVDADDTRARLRALGVPL